MNTEVRETSLVTLARDEVDIVKGVPVTVEVTQVVTIDTESSGIDLDVGVCMFDGPLLDASVLGKRVTVSYTVVFSQLWSCLPW